MRDFIRKVKSRIGRSMLPHMLPVMYAVLFFVLPSEAAEVIIIGDTQLKPVSDVVRAIEHSLPSQTRTYAPSEVRGRLKAVVNKENARAVIALGRDAMEDVSSLPESIPVVYGLLITPPRTQRQNITGVYMETPIEEYLSLINKNFPDLNRIGVIYGHDTERFVKSAEYTQIKAVKAVNSYEFVQAIRELNVDAWLLLPDKNLLSPTAIEEVYLLSFKKKIPVLGISEKHVKEGSLFALVFDTASMGRQLGEVTRAVLTEGNAGAVPTAPPQKFNLYINIDTARKMKIDIPGELVRKAKRVYP